MKQTLPFIFIIFTLASCQTQSEKIDKEDMVKSSPETIEESTTLRYLLNEKKQGFLQKADSSKITDYDNGLKAVEESGILNAALNIGDKAPDFSLKNQSEEVVSLYQLLEDGPVVLTWYRGGWCPYCNITLAFLQEKLEDFEAAGGQLVALTPELPDSSMSTADKNNLSFDILSDVGNQVAREYGVVFELTEAVANRYQNGFNLHAFNGDETNELPLAATYVINTSGSIVYAFLDVDYRNRAEPKEILEVLNSLENQVVD